MKMKLSRWIGYGLVCLTLAGCGGQGQETDTFVAAVRQIGGGLFNRGAEQAPGFTATRASLNEAGITQPVLVARFEEAGIHAGLLEFRDTRDVTIWRSLDGNTISTAGGALRNTRGFGIDLHSLETAPLERALSAATAAEYSRFYRVLDGQNQLRAIRLYCQLSPAGAERVDILGRAYSTTRFDESCYVDGEPVALFENTYWRGSGGEIWQSRQWAGPELGYADLERLIN